MGKKLTKEEFIKRSNNIHGGKYDYSKVEYVNNSTKVCIICHRHGEFLQVPSMHMKGIGCPKCGVEKRSKNSTMTTLDFIREAKLKHGEKYSYYHTEYQGCYGKVLITCPIHGDFEQAAYSHLNGHGCPKCMIERNRNLMLMSTEEFIRKAKETHPDENNDYSLVNYTGTKIPVEIICQNGHHYMQMPNKHLSGHSCPYCSHNISRPENEIADFIRELGINVETNRRDILKCGKEIDIFVPEHNMAIEFNGLYWHTEDRKGKYYHIRKTEECNNIGIRLIHIFEDEWNTKKEIVKSMISEILGVNKETKDVKKCNVAEIPYIVSRNFLNENHILGNSESSLRYGLYDNGELIAAMTFRKSKGKSGNGVFELMRFAIRKNTSVNGSADKLLSHFINKQKPCMILMHDDRRWFDGSIPESIGFEKQGETKPSCFRIQKGVRELIKMSADKENNMTKRIYDCGCLCYRLIPNYTENDKIWERD